MLLGGPQNHNIKEYKRQIIIIIETYIPGLSNSLGLICGPLLNKKKRMAQKIGFMVIYFHILNVGFTKGTI